MIKLDKDYADLKKALEADISRQAFDAIVAVRDEEWKNALEEALPCGRKIFSDIDCFDLDRIHPDEKSEKCRNCLKREAIRKVLESVKIDKNLLEKQITY